MNPYRPTPVSGVALLLAGLTLAGCGERQAGSAEALNLFTVAPRDLPITIKEVAELQALRETSVRSEVEGNSTIIFMIPEGSVVDQGELLVKLDASGLEDKLANQKISVSKAEALRDQADKSLEILEKELTTKRNTAVSNLRIAEMDLLKFLGSPAQVAGEQGQGKNADMVDKLRELVDAPLRAVADAGADPAAAASGPAPSEATAGTAADPGVAAAVEEDARIVSGIDPRRYAPLVEKVITLLQPPKVLGEAVSTDPSIGEQPTVDPLERDMGDMANRILQQVDQIRLAMADLKYQEAWVGHSRRLAAKTFLTPNELEKDEIEFERRLSRVGLAWNDLDLLISYELFKDKIKLEQDVANAGLELERVEAQNDAERLRARTDLQSKKDEYDLAKERLDNLERQIENAEIRAPTPGLVIYAREERGRRNSESVREGSSVRERQELIVLPDTTRMQAVVKVQEAVVSQVHEGQRAHIKVEAYPDRVFTGVVTRVAQQADSNSGWMSSDRKVYTTTIVIDGDNADSDLRSRMAAEVTILVDELHDVLTVPLQAVRRDRSVNYVWKQTAQGRVPTPVEVGRHNTEHVVIVSGVAAGDRVHIAQPAGTQPPDLPQPEVPMPEITTDPTTATGGAAQVGDGEPRGGRDGGDGRRQPRGEGGDAEGRRGPGGFGNMTEEQQQQMAEMRQLGEQIRTFLLARFPDKKAQIEDRRQVRQLYQDPEVKAALESELGEAWQRYDGIMQQMRSRRGGNRGGDADGEGRGEAGGERGGRDGR